MPRRMKKEIEGYLEASALRTGASAFLGVFLFTLLMITREGMETALLMGTLLFRCRHGRHRAVPWRDVVAAAGVAWLWSRYGHRVNLAAFFQVTAVFLAVFVVQLFIYGFHELTEANVLPVQRTAALGDGAVWPRRCVRQVSDVPARAAASHVAGLRLGVPPRHASARPRRARRHVATEVERLRVICGDGVKARCGGAHLVERLSVRCHERFFHPGGRRG